MSQGQLSGRGSSNANSTGGSNAGSKKWGDTTSKKGELSRVFVGNTDPKITVCDDLVSKFSKYGDIQGIDINANGFSFVQFSDVQEAKFAVRSENGSMLKGRKIEVRMFDKSGPPKRKNAGRERSRSPALRNQNFGSAMFGAPPGDSMLLPTGPPPPQGNCPPGNDIEIIAITKDQWGYAELIEQRLKRETPIKYIDLLFLHSPQHLTMTLNDLYERRTLYAIVLTPINEEHKSITLHILHNQTEHRNIPVEDAFNLINEDFRAFMIRRGLPVPVMPEKPFREFELNRQGISANGAPSNPAMISATYSTSVADATGLDEKRLPDEISYLLRTTLAEGGVQFLSLQQIDSIIEYFSRERDRLTSHARQQQLRTQTDRNPSSNFTQDDIYSQMQQKQDNRQEYNTTNIDSSGNLNQSRNTDSSTTLLDNPQVKAALNSLFQYGTISNSSQSNLNSLASSLMNSIDSNTSSGALGGNSLVANSTSNQIANSEAPSYLSTSSPMMSGATQQQSQQQQNMLRRHPLFGTEINPGGSTTVTNAYPNLVGYPQPGQRY